MTVAKIHLEFGQDAISLMETPISTKMPTMTTELLPSPVRSLLDADIQKRVNALRQTDNFTSWYYLAREYVFLAIVLAIAVAVVEAIVGGTIHWAWAVPTLIAANLRGSASAGDAHA